MADETLRYDILVNAKAAIQQLREMSEAAGSTEERVAAFSEFLIKNSRLWNVPVKELLNTFKQLNAEMAKSKKQSIFGNVGGQNIFNLSEQYLKSAQAAGTFKTSNDGVVESVRKTSGAMDKAEKSAKGWAHGIDVVKTALGTLTAVAIFQFLQTFTYLITEAVRGLRELEVSIYNLTQAERILSEQGVDITPKDLDETIKKLQELDPLLSRIEATELVSRVSRNVAPAVGFNKEQISQLSEAVAIFAVRNKALGYSFEEVEKQMTEAFTTGKVSQAINKLGIKINDQIVKDEALRLGLVKTEKEFDNLSGKMESDIRAEAMLSLVYNDAQKEIAHLPEYLKTADAAFGIFQARLQDLLTKIGEKAGPLLAQIFNDLAGILVNILDYIQKNDRAVETFITGLSFVAKVVVGLIGFFIKLQQVIGSVGAAFYKLISNFPVLNKMIDKLFGKKDIQDTPTSPFDPGKIQEDGEKVAEAVEKSEEKIQDIMEDARQKRLDIDEDYRRKIEDANRDHAQKMADIARDIQRKQEDALRNYNQKVEDINRNAAEAIAEAQADYREREVEREDDFQRRLQELRERFLMDLEDALRERDARQVLRLIREFNLEKKQLADKRRNDQEDAKRDLARKLADIERERVIKLEAAKRELAEKQAEIALWAERERQDAQIALQRKLADARAWHQRELQEYQQYLRRKLEELAKAIAKEYQLTAAGANAIYQVLKGYFGSTGAISTLLGQGLNQSLNRILSSSSGVGGSSGGWGSFAGSGLYGTFAEGGTLVATRPTKAVFGEAGPELVSFTPLGRTGRDVNKVFGSLPNVGEGASSIDLRVSLSSDLVAEIIDTSLDNVALHIERINRER